MALTINTNIASLTAQRNLQKTSLSMNQSLQRLSSGLRINSAKDDAAGLAISDRMTAQIRGLNQAVRNANDGISVSQTAEGALGEMTNIMQRIRELAVQSANTVNTQADRDSLNTEVQQLISEYDRIASQTEFNGIKVLTGAFSGNFQVGSEVGQTVGVTIENVQGDNVGIGTNFASMDALMQSSDLDNFASRIGHMQAGTGFTAGAATLNGTALDTVSATTSHNNNKAFVDAVNAKTSTHGVTAFMIGNAARGSVSAAAASTSAGDVSINGVSIAASASTTELVSFINLKTAEHGVHAKMVNSRLVLANTTGAAISVSTSTTTAQTITGFSNSSTTVAAGVNGAIILNSELNATSINTDSANTANNLYGAATTAGTIVASSEKVSALSVSSVANANLAMVTVDEALTTIDSLRSKLGAVQNRMESTIANLMNVSENLSAARSRVMDADIAYETAAMTKNSILQQAGTAILAQANQQPQLALQLLG